MLSIEVNPIRPGCNNHQGQRGAGIAWDMKRSLLAIIASAALLLKGRVCELLEEVAIGGIVYRDNVCVCVERERGVVGQRDG